MFLLFAFCLVEKLLVPKTWVRCYRPQNTKWCSWQSEEGEAKVRTRILFSLSPNFPFINMNFIIFRNFRGFAELWDTSKWSQTKDNGGICFRCDTRFYGGECQTNRTGLRVYMLCSDINRQTKIHHGIRWSRGRYSVVQLIGFWRISDQLRPYNQRTSRGRRRWVLSTLSTYKWQISLTAISSIE